MSGKNRSKNRKGDLSQYGLFNIPTDINMGSSFDDSMDADDDDIEGELLALTNSDPKPPARRKKPRPQMNVNLDEMINESIKDIPSDEELSGDDNDPDLLNELSELTAVEAEETETEQPPPSTASSPTDMVKLLEDRMKMYEIAEKNAKDAGETSRARRFNRGSKTLKDLLKQVKAGKSIKEDEIPPEVFTGTKQKELPNDPVLSPTRPAPTAPDVSQPESTDATPPSDTATASKPVDTALLALLIKRRDEYKVAAVKAKKSGDKETAMNYLKVTKQFEAVIKAVESGQTVDVSNMPASPLDSTDPLPIDAEKQTSQDAPEIPVPVETGEIAQPSLITASSVEEALQQRLEVYKKQVEAAKEQGNGAKSRRMGRIVKQYEDAIKLNKAGKSIPIDELPTPPGFAPIPVAGPPAVQPSEPSTSSSEEPSKEPAKKSPSRQNTIRISGNHVPNSRSERQIELLLAKQKELKLAALRAKKNGEIEQAKEYLRNAKRIEPLIDAASGGLPIDMSSLPISPTAKVTLDAQYDVVMAEECTEDDSSDMDVIARLESQLSKQLKMCLTTRDHNKALGDVAGTNRFERLAMSTTKDLDYVRLIHRTGGTIPKFRYEMKDFSIVKSFTELGDNDLELSILRGINYNCSNPNEIDTYVKCEMPFPQEEPWRERTSTVKNTNNPEYNATYIIPIQRSSRICSRVFKRHGIKFEVYAKGGFFRSDPLLGTTTVKLQPLETQCELHDSFDIMDGRKKTGGKLEIRLRVRHPMVTQQVQKLEEKWLVIDYD